jgi:hypothetical protein
MSAPSANTVFNKITPEKVWEGQGQPYWVAVDGGTASNLTVAGTLTATNLVATTATVSGATTLGAVTAGAINQGRVGYSSFVLAPTLTGTTLSPIAPSFISQCTVTMLLTAVTYTTPGSVTFTVSNNNPFYVGQEVVVVNTTNWNATYTITVIPPGGNSITCSTLSTFASETGLTANAIPLYPTGTYQVSAICRVTQNTAPTPGSATEGISIGLDLATAAPANYTLAPIQATTNPINTITGQYGEARFSIVGVDKVSTASNRLFVTVSTGAQTGSYNMTFSQFTVTPIGVPRS